MFEKIIDVKKIGEQKTYDLEVNNKNHNFYANDVCVGNSHALAYAYISMQCLFLKAYYPTYFYANLLNYEATDEYQNIIAAAIADGIDVLGVSINKSDYRFKVEDGKIRIGFAAMKGFGDKANEELQAFNIGQYKTIEEVLALPYKKVNSAAMQCLIDVGAFDEFGIEKEKVQIVRELYKDKKIEKWFSRKKDALTLSTMPESLLQFPETILFETAEEVKTLENPQIELINRLIPHIKFKSVSAEKQDERIKEILGFSMETVKKLSELLTLAEKYPELNLKSLTQRETDRDLCYFYILKKTVAKTKHGKPYLNLTVTDNASTIKVKCWEVLPFDEGKAYVAHLKKDNYGYTIIINSMLSEITL